MKTWIFNLLPSSMKRVVIAKDVIAQINAQRFIAKENSYVEDVQFEDMSWHDGSIPSLDVQQNFNRIKNCKVCALGACVLSVTKYKNNLKFNDLYSRRKFVDSSESNPIRQILKDIFSPKQLLLIEEAFEERRDGVRMGTYMFNEKNLTDRELAICKSYSRRYPHPEDRLIAIMKNIIKNKGTFKP